MKDEFVCSHCGKNVKSVALGTQHRNHCPFCLWSVHLDKVIPGDRAAECGGLMEPVALSCKSEPDGSVGELMLVHRCTKCGNAGKNRLAGDDESQSILDVFENSLKSVPNVGEVWLLAEADRRAIMVQLFGKTQV